MKRFAFALLAFFLHLPGAGAQTAVDLAGHVSTAPAGWKEMPAGGMRVKQFELEAAKGDSAKTELIVFFFGPGQGGSAADNVERWKGMFEKPDAKVSEETIGGVRTTLVELSGTYLYRARPMDRSPPERREGQRMIGVVFEPPGGPYFMRLVGPDKSVKQHQAAFLKWLRAFKKA